MDIPYKDIRVDVYSTGVVGNPSVRITHIPTGFVESDMSTHSQFQNRNKAMNRLIQRLEEKENNE